MLLASGLGLGSTHADSMLGLQLLVDMVTGQLGDLGEQSGAAAISRVLLAGNLLSQSIQDKDASTKVERIVKLNIKLLFFTIMFPNCHSCKLIYLKHSQKLF